ncbi:MAG: lipoyl synthase [Nitrospirota bacterium]|nr:lipoyl synthase [Nitrospirota bacterium]MDH5767872.1 lipoyl synthase [Nitrospirota bacterium]
MNTEFALRLPEWIKTKSFADIHGTKRILRNYGLSTVCEEARCPNIGECFSKPTATFMILGSKCTRNCGFCAVEHSTPEPLDPDEPERVALAAKDMGLKYVVITSVTRDDLPDGGAEQFTRTVSAIRKYLPDAKVEVLTPDFKGNISALFSLLLSGPDVYNHNVETIPRLYPFVRPQANYSRSLTILKYAREIAPETTTKSGLMLGLGETLDEVIDVLGDLSNVNCDSVTIGQYLRPSRSNLPVVEYVKPEIFEKLRLIALCMGFKHVASSPLVRSSMDAENFLDFREA